MAKLTEIVGLKADITYVDAEATTRAMNDGDLAILTTDAKDNLVNAINEVDSHIDAKSVSIVRYDTLSGDGSTTDFEVTKNGQSIPVDISTFLTNNATVYDSGSKVLSSSITFSFDNTNSINNISFNTAPSGTVEIEAIQLT